MYSIIIKGGFMMVPILAGSIIALAIFFERLIYFLKIKEFNKLFSAEIKKLINDRNIAGAVELCSEKEKEPLANIFLAGIKNITSGKEAIKVLELLKDSH